MEKNIDARVLLLNEKNQVFLILDRSKIIKKPDGNEFVKPERWGMPGGRSEPEDEDEIAVAEREVEHETGIFPEINQKLRVESQREDHLKVAFVGYLTPGTIKIDQSEILDSKWFSIRVLYDDNFNMYGIQRRMARELLRKIGK